MVIQVVLLVLLKRFLHTDLMIMIEIHGYYMISMLGFYMITLNGFHCGKVCLMITLKRYFCLTDK